MKGLSEQVINGVNVKIAHIGLTFNDILGSNIYFGGPFNKIGTYVYKDRKGFHLLTLNIHGVESKEIYKCFEELIMELIWNGLLNYVQKNNKYKPDSRKIALELMKKIDDNYYNKIKR